MSFKYLRQSFKVMVKIDYIEAESMQDKSILDPYKDNVKVRMWYTVHRAGRETDTFLSRLVKNLKVRRSLLSCSTKRFYNHTLHHTSIGIHNIL